MRIGQAATGRVITAAATIMIFVFGSFLLAGQRVIAEFGIGLASAVFLDAFILRTVLVPGDDAHARRPQLVAAARPRPRAAAPRRGGRREVAGRSADPEHKLLIAAQELERVDLLVDDVGREPGPSWQPRHTWRL